jgi:hypothetical protein
MFNPYDTEVDHIATPGEAVEEWRFNVGPDRADEAWILHDRDVWVRNPYYVGPPQPHPEDEGYYASVGFTQPPAEEMAHRAALDRTEDEFAARVDDQTPF